MAQTVARYSPHKMDTNKKKHPKRPRNHIYIEQTVEAMQMMQVLWGGVVRGAALFVFVLVGGAAERHV